MANVNRDDRPRLSRAADAALDELVNELRADVLTEASRRAPGDVLSAADVVRAYYRVTPSAQVPGLPSSQLRPLVRSMMRNIEYLTFTIVLLLVSAVGLTIGGFVLPGGSVLKAALWTFAGVSALASAGYVAILSSRLKERARSRVFRDWTVTINGDQVISNEFRRMRSEFGLGEPGHEVVEASRNIFLRRWIEIESNIERLYASTVAAELQSARRPFGAKVAELRLNGLLTPAVNKKLVELLKVRNEMVHSRETSNFYPEMLADIDFVNRELDSLISEKSATA